MPSFQGSKALLLSFVFLVSLCKDSVQAANPSERDPAKSTVEVQKSAKDIAKRFATHLPAKAEVFVRPFVTLGVESDLGFQFEIGEAMKNMGFPIKRGATFEIGGSIKRDPADDSKPVTGLLIAVTLTGAGIDTQTLVFQIDSEVIRLRLATGDLLDSMQPLQRQVEALLAETACFRAQLDEARSVAKRHAAPFRKRRPDSNPRDGWEQRE